VGRDAGPSSQRRPRTRRCVSVMWRPFLFRRLHCFGLCRLDSLRERIDPRAQRSNLLALPIYDIAQFDVGTLQERYFRFQPLDCFAVHFDSVTVISGTGAGCMPQQTIETKLEVSLLSMASRIPLFKRHLRHTTARKCLFFQLRGTYQTFQPTSSVARRRRVYLPRPGD
jgi:hypothetical protein